MNRLDAAELQYEAENNFPSEHAESQFLEARDKYIAKQKNDHLKNPKKFDLDVLSYEDGQLLTFIKNYPNGLLAAAKVLVGEIEKQAEMLAEEDADDADYDTIMAAL